MKCPKCATALTAQVSDEATVHRCGNCEGHWVTRPVFEELVRRRKKAMSVEKVREALASAQRGVPGAKWSGKPACPACATAMHPLNYAYSSGIILSVCPKDHSLWFDKDELEAARAYAHQHPRFRQMEREKPLISLWTTLAWLDIVFEILDALLNS